MPVVYLAGAIRAPTVWEYEQNIRKAETIALELWNWGLAVISPHKNSYHWGGAVPIDLLLAGDIEMMLRCDMVVLLPDWIESAGTVAEVKVAGENNMPLYFWSLEGDRETLRTWHDEYTVTG